MSLFIPAIKSNAQICNSDSDCPQGAVCTTLEEGANQICQQVDPKTGQPVLGYKPSTTGGGGIFSFFGNIAYKVVLKIIQGLAYVVFAIVGLLLKLGGALLDFVLTNVALNQFTQSPVVQTGWGIARNTANMFFALILLIISFATILRIESYGIKQVLPRLIIAALLINFSLTIGGVIIDFTQVLTKYFVDQALAGTTGSFSGTIASKLNVAEGMLKSISQDANTQTFSDSLDGIAAAVIGLFAGIVVVLVAAFTFFAAAFFLVVRYIALLFLLILAPLAWLFYILPNTRSYWNQWWSTFFKWAFFAPAYTFFLFLAMEIIKSDVVSQVGINANTAAGAPGFGRYSIPTIINFVIIIGFLLGSIMVAQKLGVMGAGAAMAMVKRAGKGTGKFIARKGTGYDRIAPAATRLSGTVIAQIPGLRNWGKSIQGRAIQMRDKQMERPGNKAYATYMKSLSPDDQIAEMNRARGQNRLIATQTAQASGALVNAPKANAQSIQIALESLRAFGKIKEATDLEELRPDAAANAADRRVIVQRAIQSGASRKWGTQVFEGTEGQEIMKELQANTSFGDFVSTYKGWSKQARDSANKAMEANFSNVYDMDTAKFEKDDHEARRKYAATSDNIKMAFSVGGVVVNNSAADHVQRMTGANIGAVMKDEDLRVIGEHITLAQLSSIRGELSADQKKSIKDAALTTNRADQEQLKKFFENNTAWNV